MYQNGVTGNLKTFARCDLVSICQVGMIAEVLQFDFDPAPCPWDLNGNGYVGFIDFLLLLTNFGPCENCPADFDRDGIVGVIDYFTLLAHLGWRP